MKKPEKSTRRTKRSAAKDLPVAKGQGVKGGALAVAGRLMPNPPPIMPDGPPITPVSTPTPPPIRALMPQPPPI